MAEFKDLPVIVQTAHATRDNLVRLMKYDVRIAMTKPPDEVQLMERVVTVLETYRYLLHTKAESGT